MSHGTFYSVYEIFWYAIQVKDIIELINYTYPYLLFIHMGCLRHVDYQHPTQATKCLMDPLKGALDNAVELPEDKCFDLYGKAQGVYPLCLCFPSCPHSSMNL